MREVALSHGARAVFGGLSLRLAGGRWHAVLGRSGVGKSTLLRAIAGLRAPDAGRIEADDGAPLAPRLAYLAQDDGLLPWLSVRENVLLGPRLRGRRDAADEARARDLLGRVGLGGCGEARPGALSGGMRQRVALARTLLEGRPVVLMDEPFSRLDALTRAELQDLARELLAGCTVVLVTHDPLEAMRLADTVTVLHGGAPSRLSTLTLDGSPPRDPDDVAVVAGARALRERLAGPGTPARAGAA